MVTLEGLPLSVGPHVRHVGQAPGSSACAWTHASGLLGSWRGWQAGPAGRRWLTAGDSLRPALGQPLTQHPPRGPIAKWQEMVCPEAPWRSRPSPTVHLGSVCPRDPPRAGPRHSCGRRARPPGRTSGLTGQGVGFLGCAGERCSRLARPRGAQASRRFLPSRCDRPFSCRPSAERTARPAADSLRHPDGRSVATWAAFAVEGMKMEAQAKALPARPARVPPSKTKGCRQPPKIRNYNLKD